MGRLLHHSPPHQRGPTLWLLPANIHAALAVSLAGLCMVAFFWYHNPVIRRIPSLAVLTSFLCMASSTSLAASAAGQSVLHKSWTNNNADVWSVHTNEMARIESMESQERRLSSLVEYAASILSLDTAARISELRSGGGAFFTKRALLFDVVDKIEAQTGERYWKWKYWIGLCNSLLNEYDRTPEAKVEDVGVAVETISFSKESLDRYREDCIQRQLKIRQAVETNAYRAFLQDRYTKEAKRLLIHSTMIESDLERMTPEQRREIEAGIDSIRRGAFDKE